MTFEFELTPRPPFRLDLTVWALRRQPGNRIDAWDGRRYARGVALGASVLRIAVEQGGVPAAPRLLVAVQGPEGRRDVAQELVSGLLRRALGLDIDLEGFYRFAASDAALAPLAARFRGMKPPRFPALFEALANAIACQQVSLASGIAMLGKLASALAPQTQCDAGVLAFPQPRAVLAAGPEFLRDLGWSRQKTDYLLAAAAAIENGALCDAQLAQTDDAQVLRLLSRLHGIKRWSAQYVALRGLGRLTVFPVDDVGAHKHLALWLGLPERLDAQSTQALMARWQPYAGMVYFHILLKRLKDAGHLDSQHACTGGA
ncbi:MAG: DNA-3-methyladenine glycosylase 2 family protein [Betaproteobacteria bacterium]|nr:DNA-3-methyladenine glycosylase 2 family protein [Betaproteobacteria bacterium]